MTTNIDNLIGDDETSFESDSILDQILNMDSSQLSRVQLLDTLDDKTQLEMINKINSMYTVSNTTLLKDFIIFICKFSKIKDILKIESCKVLCQKEPKNIDHFKLLDDIIINHYNSLPVPCKIVSIVFLSYHPDMTEVVLSRFQEVITDINIECDFRYKIILNLDTVYHLDKATFVFPLLLFFIKSQYIFTSYRILASQNLLQNYKDNLTESQTNYIYTILASFAQDEELDYNIRADATDVLLGLGDEHYQALARDIIRTLGNRGKTIFDDAQNIHNTTIDQSTEPILKVLFSTKMKDTITFNKIKTEMLSPIKEEIKKLTEKLDNLEITFSRIELDRSLYGSVHTTLNNLLCRVKNYITNHPCETELTNRLEEELIEASGKCSTGYGTRLVNVLSGYDGMNLKISYEDSINSKLSGRLNKLVKEIENDEERDQILLEMTLNTDKDILCRKNFLTFFKKHISSIKEDIWEDVKEDIDWTDYELYFRKAMSQYEGIQIF